MPDAGDMGGDGASADSSSDADDGVVDADFEEVDDERKKDSA
jgi:molecular chaperone DnaK